MLTGPSLSNAVDERRRLGVEGLCVYDAGTGASYLDQWKGWSTYNLYCDSRNRWERRNHRSAIDSDGTRLAEATARLGGLAQVVEQPVHTRYVPGSSPGTATNHRPDEQARSTLPEAARVASVARVRRAVATAADRRSVLRSGETVLVACSGGPDSTALLDALVRLAASRGWKLAAAHVDHGLRPASGAEAEVVEAIAHEIPVHRLHVHVEAGGSLQDRARRARLAALRRCATAVGASVIAFGHTADDQAETVLMRALTSATPHSLVAMAEREGYAARPLLRVWREQTRAYCEALGLRFVDDPSNTDPRFLRTRVRHDLLPALERVFPGARRRLWTLADRQRNTLSRDENVVTRD